ncbi:hypothetical protein ACFQS7_15900 [Dankookia sp. GCM10030260]|uniref:hypothetical protein n=1 Tax=Dankookia sp. GCM10030260 TaxID=3273390 RepID=UPI00361C060F
MSDDTPPEDLPPKQGYIPRPPSQADVDLVSGQQGMIADEWAAEPAPDGDTPKDKPAPG